MFSLLSRTWVLGGEGDLCEGLWAAVDWAWVEPVLFNLHSVEHSKTLLTGTWKSGGVNTATWSHYVCVGVCFRNKTHTHTHMNTSLLCKSCPAAEPLSTLCVRVCACLCVNLRECVCAYKWGNELMGHIDDVNLLCSFIFTGELQDQDNVDDFNWV